MIIVKNLQETDIELLSTFVKFVKGVGIGNTMVGEKKFGEIMMKTGDVPVKNTHNTLTCLFGYHDYSQRTTKDKRGYYAHFCKICKRSSHIMWPSGVEIWLDYDKVGRVIHEKWSNGYEVWRDHNKKGHIIWQKWKDGSIIRYDEKGNLIHSNGQKN